jgi:hypothetical protein
VVIDKSHNIWLLNSTEETMTIQPGDLFGFGPGQYSVVNDCSSVLPKLQPLRLEELNIQFLIYQWYIFGAVQRVKLQCSKFKTFLACWESRLEVSCGPFG